MNDSNDRTGRSMPLREDCHIPCWLCCFLEESVCSRRPYIPSGVAKSEARRSHNYREDVLENYPTKGQERTSVHVRSDASSSYHRDMSIEQRGT